MADTRGKMTPGGVWKDAFPDRSSDPIRRLPLTLPTCRGWVLPMVKSMGSGMFHGGDVENCGQCAHEGHPISSSGFENHHMPHSKCQSAAYPPIIRHTDVFSLKSAGAVLKLKEESVAKSYHHLWTYDGGAAGIHQELSSNKNPR